MGAREYDEFLLRAEEQIEWLEGERSVFRAERDHARASLGNAVKMLTGIHALLYPAPVKLEDGRTMVFRPESPDPHEVLQALSDRIRALPDELAALVEPVGAVLVNRETREGVMFYSPDMIPDPATLKDRFELVHVFAAPHPA